MTGRGILRYCCRRILYQLLIIHIFCSSTFIRYSAIPIFITFFNDVSDIQTLNACCLIFYPELFSSYASGAPLLYISCFLSTDLCGEPAGEWVPMTSCCLGFTLFSLVLLGAQTGGQGAHLLFWNETIFIQDVADKFFEQHVDQTSAKSPTNLTYFVRC